MKIKSILVLVLLIGLNVTTQAYTKKDIQYYRTVSALASLTTDVITSLNKIQGVSQPEGSNIFSQIPDQVNAILSAALEENQSLEVTIGKITLILTDIQYPSTSSATSKKSIDPSLEIILKGIAAIIIITIVRQALITIINKKWAGRDYENKRRIMRTFATTITIGTRDWVVSSYSKPYGECILSTLRETATAELLGALIAQKMNV